MQLKDLRKFATLSPEKRAAEALRFGAELKKKRRRSPPRGRLPGALHTEKMGVLGRVLARLHGVRGAAPARIRGLRSIGTLKIAGRKVADLVLTPQVRKSQARRALARSAGETMEHIAVRQLAVAMGDKDPIPRLCAAYGYWQSTGAVRAVVPILTKGLESRDPEEFGVAAHCLANVKPSTLSRLVGTAADDQAKPSRRPPVRSMTVIIHGTFARKAKWYKPGGDFHRYIKGTVFSDVYSGKDYFFWSGRYLHRARKKAARKLVAWCRDHPAHLYRFISHSHGANVVNIATGLGLSACTLIHLSPPVHKRYLPKMANVSSQQFFTIRPRIDAVVFIDGGRQNYRGTPVERFEQERICALFGHSKSHGKKRWQKKKVPKLVRQVCK